ncbi:MAG: serine hydrolase [bacterium]
MRITAFLLNLIFGISMLNIPLGQDIEKNENTEIAGTINEFMSDCFERGLFNGCVMVTKENEIVYEKAFGYSDIFNRIPLNIDSKFDIGSITKSFTAMAVMILEEEGKLCYSDTLSKFFPEFPDYANKITIHHLLCHQSGIPDYANELAMTEKDLTPETIIKRLASEELNFYPGTNSMYSNSGYFLLGQIIEKVTGVSYGEYITEKIFKPLGMINSIVYDKKEIQIADKCIGINFPMPEENHVTFSGDGGIYTTVNDLSKWHLELCNPTLVSQQSMDRATTPALLNNGEQSREGYGWHIKYKNNKKIIEHGGASPAGYISYIFHPVSCEYSITLLTNFFVSPNFGIVLNGLMSILDGSPPKEIKSPAMYRLNKYILENGNEYLKTIFDDFNSDTLKYTPFDELGFIQLSSFYKNRKHFEAATAILNIYSEEFPGSLIPLEELVDISKLTGDVLLNATEKRLKDLKDELDKHDKVEIELLNPKTADYEMSLVVRCGPGSEYEIISAIKPGEAYVVIGRSLDGEWLKLKGDGWLFNRQGRMSAEQCNSLPFLRFNKE